MSEVMVDHALRRSGSTNNASRCLRVALHLTLAIVLSPFPSSPVHGESGAEVKSATVGADAAVAYVLSCRKPNGAFGPVDQSYTDAAWNFPAVKTLLLLNQRLAKPQAVLKNGIGYPQGHVGYGHWQFYHQHLIRKSLGAPMTAEHRRVRLVHQGFEVRYYGSPFGTGGDVFFKAGGGSEPEPRDVAASELGYYNLSSLYYLLAGLDASDREAANSQELLTFITRRQAPNGGFVDVRTPDGQPTDDEAHVAHTFHAVAALKLLGAEIPHADRCARFIRSCQLLSGAFRWNPNSALPGNDADVYYIWAAAGALGLLGERPEDEKACVNWINSLQNHDGGFGDRPGWRSRLYSTYYAVHALDVLTGDARRAITTKQRAQQKLPPIPQGRYGIYQGLNKMPVCEADDLDGLRARKFNLLALKSNDFALAQSLREEMIARKLAMDVVLCTEAYPHRARRFGGPLLDHIANVTLDPRWNDEQRTRWLAADAAGRSGLAWPDYQQQVIAPLRELGGLFYPEQDFEMEYAYSAYDDGLAGQPSYNAVLAGFNWSPRDFVRVFPWRERYVDKLTPIADADAHGDLKTWSPQLDHTRHLFIAQGPTYADFLEAAANGRVVCVIYGAEGTDSVATYYGPPPAVDYVKQHIAQWKWWD
jgi:prenyltransferase beta subunit